MEKSVNSELEENNEKTLNVNIEDITDNSNNIKRKEKNNGKFSKNWMTFYVLTLIALVFSELYVVIQENNNYVVFIGLLIVIIIFSYLCIDELIKFIKTIFKYQDSKVDLHIKSQKAIYSVINKEVNKLTDQLQYLTTEIHNNNENNTNVLKAVTKVIVKKNQEFSNNIVNEVQSLNSKNFDNTVDISGLIDKIEEFENNISNSLSHIDKLLMNQENVYNTSVTESSKTAEGLNKIIALLEENISESTNNMFNTNSQTVENESEDTKPEENKVEESKPEDNKAEASKVEESKPEDNKAEASKVEESKPENSKSEENNSEILTSEDGDKQLDNENVENNDDSSYKVDLPDDIDVDLTDPNKQLSPEDISALFASMQ